MTQFFTLSRQKVPTFFYGTAWKQTRTEDLVYKALKSGFRALDTANQRRHYDEEAVGKGFRKYLATHDVDRKEIFLQSKFTYARGQDHRKPYDDDDLYEDQVYKSFMSTLMHFGVDTLDSFILHGPFGSEGLTPEDWEVWEAMENLKKKKKVKFLGVSNFNLAQVKELHEKSDVKPSFVQNRCFSATQWDKGVREFCKENKMLYQAFSLLTANRRDITHPEKMLPLLEKYQRTVPQIVFKFAIQMGMIPLTGTSDVKHMAEDLNLDFEIEKDDLKAIEDIGLKPAL